MSLVFRPKLDKIVELLLHLAHVRPDADKYQAVKFFYLADRAHINRYGRPITHEAYFALPFGPVASNAMDLLEGDQRTLTKTGLESLPFRTQSIPREEGGKDFVIIKEPERDVDKSLFSKSDLRVFDDVIREHGSKSFDDLFKITHKHFAYQKAWRSRRPGSRRAEMYYLDMIEDEDMKRRVLEDFGPVSAYME